MKRITAILVIITTLLSLSFNVMADNSTVSVLVNTEIKFKLNGCGFTPVDQDYKCVYPLTYNGRTYIPARGVAEVVGLEVLWDGETQTVGFETKNTIIGLALYSYPKKPGEKFYDNAIINKAIKFTFNGEAFVPREDDGTVLYPLTYKDSTYIPARFIMERAGIEVTWDGETQTIGLNTPDNSSLNSTEVVGNGTFKSLKDVKDYVQKESLNVLNDQSNGTMTSEEKVKFRETALKGMILFGFNLVPYSNYEKTLDVFPSYAEVYAYYMKNEKGKSDAEILKHLSEIYMTPMEAIDLVPVVEVATNIWDSDFVTNAWYKHDNDPNQNNKYILKHLAFIDNFNLGISPLPERGLVVKNTSSGALLLDSNDSGSYFAFKINETDISYLEMMKYYYKQVYGIEPSRYNDNAAYSSRIYIQKLENGYVVHIK